MSLARRIRVIDEQGDAAEDLLAVECMRKPLPPSNERPVTPAERRDIRFRAILSLERAGFTVREIAAAVGYTERWIRDKRAQVKMIKEFARQSGRV